MIKQKDWNERSGIIGRAGGFEKIESGGKIFTTRFTRYFEYGKQSGIKKEEKTKWKKKEKKYTKGFGYENDKNKTKEKKIKIGIKKLH